MAAGGINAGEFVLLGKITKPHGIRGEVKVYPFSGQPENFLNYKNILLGMEDSEERIPYRIDKARIQGKMVLLQLRDCTTRNEAESLVGRQVWLRRSDLPAPEEDEFYLLELEGKNVVTIDGQELGRVTGVLATAGHDILTVTGMRHEYLIPVEKSFIVRIDDKEVVLDVPPGLLDINRK
ncbi:MAG: ribosome maturation factor RimM [Desulfobulbaceae bacterium]|nr:ribosome maturation factor RimM [Desulfobulbaceae bacterium]